MPQLLLFALLALSALAYDVGDWPEVQLKAHVAQVVDPSATVLEAVGVPLERAGSTRGVILGRYQLGDWSYARVLTVFERDGQSWVSSGWGGGGCVDAVVLGLLDLETPSSIALHRGWAASAPQEPTEPAKRPVLVVLTKQRYEDGVERTEALLLDLSDPERPWQLLRTVVDHRLPVWDPRSDMPVQRSLGSEGLSLSLSPSEAGAELVLIRKDISTPDSRCLEPEPEIVRFLLEEGRFVEQRPASLHQPCP